MDSFAKETQIDRHQSSKITPSEAPARFSKTQPQFNIDDQASRVLKLESQIKLCSERVNQLKEHKQQLEEQVKYDLQLTHNQQRFVRKKLDLLAQESFNKDQRLETFQELLSLLRQKEALLSFRVNHLEDLVKRAETLLITLDYAYHELITSNQTFGFKTLSPYKVLILDERKKQHDKGLASTREHYQKTISELEALDREISGMRTRYLFTGRKSPYSGRNSPNFTRKSPNFTKSNID